MGGGGAGLRSGAVREKRETEGGGGAGLRPDSLSWVCWPMVARTSVLLSVHFP